MKFWKTLFEDRTMLVIQCCFWCVYGCILYVRNVMMPANPAHQYTFVHVLWMLAIVLVVFYAVAWLIWLIAHAGKKVKWVVLLGALLVVLVPILYVLFDYVLPEYANLWFFDRNRIPEKGMVVYRIAQKYFHFSAEAGLLVSRYVIREKALEEGRLVASNHRLQIQFITGVINPHFLMNTLQLLQNGFRKVDAGLAAVAGKLSELLRYGLEHAKAYTLKVPLANELTQAGNYLGIQSARFDRAFAKCLHVTGDIAGWLLPPMTLMTILENVFAHGAVKKTAGMAFTLAVSATESQLTITCRNRIRKRARYGPSTGIGLGILRQRLAAAFGNRAELQNYVEGDEYVTLITVMTDHGKA